MAQVNVLINGRDYRLACEDGQEHHLRALAQKLDRQMQELKQGFGEVGDARLSIMAALTLIDQLDEERRSKAELETALKNLRAETDDRFGEAEDIITEVLTAASERVERLTAALSAGPV